MTAILVLEPHFEGFEAVEAALARLDPFQGEALLEGLARLLQEQTRRRLLEEKRAPDGNPWRPNRTSTPILYRSGALARSIDYAVSGRQIRVGSGLVYAGLHHQGGTIVPKQARRLAFRLGGRLVFARRVVLPARPFLGISAGNAEDLLDAVARFLQRLLGGGR